MQNPKYDMTTLTFTQSNNTTPPSTTDGYANEFTLQLPYPMNLINSKLCLQELFCYNAFPNIRKSLGNNKLAYIIPNDNGSRYDIPTHGTGWRRYEIETTDGLGEIKDGMFDASTLNKLLKYNFDKNGHYIIDNQGKRLYPIEISVNEANYRIHFAFRIFQNPYPASWYPLAGRHPFVKDRPAQPDPSVLPTNQYLPDNIFVWLELPDTLYLAGQPSKGVSSWKRILGYNNKIIPYENTNSGSNLGLKLDNLFKMDGDYAPSSSEQDVVHVTCNLVNNSLVSATKGSIIHSFSPAQATVGRQIIEKPFHNFIPIVDGMYTEIKLRLIDQFNQPMPLIDSQFGATVVIHRPIEELKSESYKRSRVS